MPRTTPQPICLTLPLLAGCGQFVLGQEPGGWGGVLVAQPPEGAVVIDARTEAEWAAGHIPGAAQVHWTELTGFDEDELWDLRPVAELEALLGARGIPSDRPVVVYGSGPEGWGDDGNVYWVLRHLGSTGVQVLDGGYLGWLASGGDASTRLDAPDAVSFHADPDDALLATTAEVEGGSGALLDVRSEEEWSDGRIPGAVWYAWDAVFQPDATLRPAEALRAELADLGVTPDAPVVTYCAAGIRAGHTFMVLEALGFPEASNYVGSWARWTAEGGRVEP